jgi:sporulation protein YlmC with PRC-barrel domain
MGKITTVVAIALVLSIGLWTLNPTQSLAQRSSAKAGIAASAHVSGVVIGKQVRNERGIVLGSVENVVLNDNGCAQYVILSGKFRGARSRLYPIPWTVIARTGPDGIFADLDPAYLVEAPSFETGRWPDFSQPQWETKVRTFYEKRPERAGPGELGKTPRNVRSEDKGKADRELRAKQKQSGTPATEGTAPMEEKSKGKARVEGERKHKPSDISPQGAVESPKQGERDIKTKQHKPDTSGMIERGKTQMERGRSEQEKPEQKGAPGQVGVPVGPGQEHEKIR